MNLFKRLRTWRAEKKEDQAAIDRAHEEALRAGDEPQRSLSDTVQDVADTFPPPA